MKYGGVCLLVAVFGCMEYAAIEALQCYVCDNCGDSDTLEELQLCGTLPGITTTGSPDTTTTTRPVNAGSGEDGAEYDYSDEDEANKINSTSTTRVTRRTSTTTTAIRTRRSTRRTTTTTKAAAGDYDEEYDEDDDDDRRRKRALDQSKIKIRAGEPVCYLYTHRVNNTLVTNRGCSATIDENNYITCMSLHNDLVLENCHLCTTNGCNKYLSNGTEVDIPPEWNAAQLSAGRAPCLLVLTLWALMKSLA